MANAWKHLYLWKSRARRTSAAPPASAADPEAAEDSSSRDSNNRRPLHHHCHGHGSRFHNRQDPNPNPNPNPNLRHSRSAQIRATRNLCLRAWQLEHDLAWLDRRRNIDLENGVGSVGLGSRAWLIRNNQLPDIVLQARERLLERLGSVSLTGTRESTTASGISGDESAVSHESRSREFIDREDETSRDQFNSRNVGMSESINFRIQNHQLKLVELEGSHTIQNVYDSLDIHVGQSMTVLVTLNQSPRDYYIVASSRFARKVLTATATLRYSNSNAGVSGPVPAPPATGLHWSMRQARTFRWNLTASAARPNPQGSYHYGTIPRTRSLVFANSAPVITGKQRYAVNGVSYVVPATPLKLADNFNIAGVFTWDSIPSNSAANVLGTPVLRFNLHDFVEIVFQNTENTMQSWHLDGYDFWVVGYGSGKWSDKMRRRYNLVDAVTRHTVQVYPYGWTAILVSLDNQGMWNVRSAMWARQYLGQQFYIRVWSPEQSFANEYAIPSNALMCGKAAGFHP